MSQQGCALEACPPVARQVWTDELYTERTLALEERTQAKHTCQLYTRSPLQNTGLECEPPLQNTSVWCSGSTDTSTAHVPSKDTAQQTDLVSCRSTPRRLASSAELPKHKCSVKCRQRKVAADW